MPSPPEVAYSPECFLHRCQGDVYSRSSFPNGGPDPAVPYWMVMNRTCHLYEGNARTVKLPHLVFCVVFDLTTLIKEGRQKTRNQVSALVTGKSDEYGFLPECPDAGIDLPLVVSFNLIRSVSIEKCPAGTDKILQLRSPFCEQVMQRFTRWFYTVSVNDEPYRSREYIDWLTEQIERRLK